MLVNWRCVIGEPSGEGGKEEDGGKDSEWEDQKPSGFEGETSLPLHCASKQVNGGVGS